MLAAALVGCTDTKTIDTPMPGGMQAGRIALNPVFSQSARTIAASLGEFGLAFDRVRIAVRKSPDSTRVVSDTTVTFGPTSNSVTLDVAVPVDSTGEVFNALVQYIGSSGVVFSGSVLVKSHAPNQPAPGQGSLVISFVGPGAKLKTITLAPDPVQLSGSTTTPITITATDSSGASITVPPLVFNSSDSSIAIIANTSTGRVVQSFNKRGTALLTATTPTGISDILSANVTLPPAAIVLVSGANQRGTVGAALASSAVVQVNATDGAPIAGVGVTFAAPIGGSVGTTTATTDANGQASTTMTLATTTGTQQFLATAAGFNVAIPATAIAGAASPTTSTITPSVASIKADNTTSTTVVVQLKDQFGNPITTGGATVRLTTNLGHFGSIGAVTTLDATDLANGSYSAQLFSARPGAATITGTVGGVAITTPATVTVTAIPPAAIVLVSGGGQRATVGTTLTSPAVVQVNSASGVGIPDVPVTFAAPAGASVGATTATTDASGQASTTLTLATTSGSQSFTAAAAGFSVPIPAIAVAAAASPTTSTIGASIATIKADNNTPTTITVQLKDQFGNAITTGGAAVKLTTTLGHFGSIGAVTTIDATDLGNGSYSAQLFSARPGTATITGTLGGVAIVATTTVTVNAIPPAAIILVSGGGQRGTVGTTLTSPAVVQVNSADGVGIPDVPVTFSAPSGASAGTASVTTDASGHASTTMTLATTAGSQSFTATASTFSVSIPETAVAAAAAPATSTISSNVTQINADNSSAAIITVRTKDQFGNTIATGGATVTLATTLGRWSTTNGTATTAANDVGDGTYTATLTSAQSGTATITGTIGGTAIAAPSVTINAIATVVDHFDVTLANGSAISGNQQAGVATALKITARDLSGNVVAGYSGPTTLAITNSTFGDGSHSLAAPAPTAGVINLSATFGAVGSNVTLTATGAGKTGLSGAFTVIAGPPSVLISSDTTSTFVYTAGQTPSVYPTFTVKDGGGNPVPQQNVAFTVTSPCTLQGAQLSTDATGTIALSGTTLTIPSAAAGGRGFSCRLTASPVGFSAPTLLVALVTQPAAGTAWTGRTSDAWELRDNWTADVPSSNTAFIAAAQSRAQSLFPVLRSTPSIGSVDVEDGAQLSLNGNTLSIFQNVDARTTGVITNGTINVPSGANGGTMRGALPNVTCQGGHFTLSGLTLISNSLTLSNCVVDLNNQTATVAQNLAMSAGATLVMNQASSALQVAGNASFAGGVSTLSAGSIAFGGDFSVASGGVFAPSGSHTVTLGLGGPQNQVIRFDDVASSWFQNLNVAMVTGSAVAINSAVRVRGEMRVTASTGGTLSLPVGLSTQGNGPIIVTGTMAIVLGRTITTSSLTLSGGTVTLVGNGVLSLGGGTLQLGDGLTLIVNAMGSLIDSPPNSCTHGSNVSISGTNTDAVTALKQACGIP
jgi:adhesin/invasin